MPGPGAHLMYAMASGVGLTTLTGGRFTPHHTLTYTINAFFGPDIGSFSDWLSSFFASSSFVSRLADSIHHPLYYILILGIPFSFFYSWLSNILLRRKLLDSASGVPLSRKQCLYLISAGSLSHFFLDHLFEVPLCAAVLENGQENGHSSMYTWILSTGWWENRAPINPDAVLFTGFLCTSLILGFVYVNRVKPMKSLKNQTYQSYQLVVGIAICYCLWCASQIYWVKPRRPAIGEEADLGVVIFLAVYFFLPHFFCSLSLNPRDHQSQQLPL
ncbi:unnamed protein product [Linum tenue]|uniref:Uncharacterized protein n=1 Tax=Linum tenue TaxID=586396 RepID=A0AAV0IMR0_9ROSI|nr:unnamed protein product [Linum tenue]